MAHLHDLFFTDGHFLGFKKDPWEIVGFIGLGTFSVRFLVQWYVTEKKKQVVVPTSFWWLSIAGSLILLAYSFFYKHEVVFILSYAFNCIPYFRNLIIHHRHAREHRDCPNCGVICPPKSNYCFACGTKL